MGTQEWNLYTPYKLTQSHTRLTFQVCIQRWNSCFGSLSRNLHILSSERWIWYILFFYLKYTKKNNHPQNTKQMLEILFIEHHCVIGGHQPNIFQIFYNNLIFSYYCPPVTSPDNWVSTSVPLPPLISFHLQIFSIEKLENKRMFVKINRQTYQTIYHVALLKNCSNFLCNVPLFSYSLKNVCNITPRKICIHL